MTSTPEHEHHLGCAFGAPDCPEYAATPEPEPMSRAERIVGKATGRALLWLGKRAADRRDWHEVNHCIAALAVGASDHPGPCNMPTGKPITLRPTVSWGHYPKERTS